MNTTTARNLVRSWLRANKIPFTKSTVAGCDFCVQGRLGDIEVRVCDRRDETVPAPGVIDILASDITGKKLDVAFAAYNVITSAAGYGSPKPVDRGEQPEQKLCYTDEDFLVCVRHTAFRRSPNAPTEKYQKYDKVMHKACWNFYNLNNAPCRRWGKSVEDLRTYAMVLLNIFCAQIEDEEKDDQHNEQTLYVWLRQRFAEVFKILSAKERSTMPDADTISIALFGEAYKGRANFNSEGEAAPIAEDSHGGIDGSMAFEADDVEYKIKHRKLDTSNPTARKKSAAKTLKDSLEALGHDKMVYALGFAHQNILINSDARREAGKQLRAHVAGCGDCMKAIKEMIAHADATKATKVATHLRDCDHCAKNKHLVSALAEVDVDEETGLESLGSEE